MAHGREKKAKRTTLFEKLRAGELLQSPSPHTPERSASTMKSRKAVTFLGVCPLDG